MKKLFSLLTLSLLIGCGAETTSKIPAYPAWMLEKLKKECNTEKDIDYKVYIKFKEKSNPLESTTLKKYSYSAYLVVECKVKGATKIVTEVYSVGSGNCDVKTEVHK